MSKAEEPFDPNVIGRCPHPFKHGFPNEERATEYMVENGILDLMPYPCRCGSWHNGHPLGRNRGRKFRDLQARIIGDGEVVIDGAGVKRVRRVRHRAAG